MFARLARFVVRHPWYTIVAWLIIGVLVVFLAPGAKKKSDQKDFMPSKYESIQATKVLSEAFPQHEDATAFVVVKRTDGAPITPADSAKVTAAAKALTDKHYKSVQGFMAGPQTLAPNKAVQIISVPMTGTDSKAQKAQGQAIKDMRKDIPSVLGSGLTAKVGGDTAAFTDNEKSFAQSMAIVSGATFILIIGLILLIFRAPLAALLPILVIMLTEVVTTKLIGLASHLLNFSTDDSLQIILTIVLFGVGADYYLFVLFRYRERLRAGEDKKTALITAVERVGEVITSAAAAIAATFLVLMLASFGLFAAWGPSLAIAVVAMGITSLTLVPALLSLLGTATFWPSKSWKKQPKARASVSLGKFVGGRPLIVALGTGALMIALAAGAFSFKADYDFQSGFPQNTESAQAAKDMQKGFPPGLTTPVQVLLKSTDGGAVPKTSVAEFREKAKTLPGVGTVQPGVPSAKGDVVRVDLLLKQNPNDNASITLVKDKLGPAAHKITPAGTKLYVGGATAIYSDMNKVVNRDLSVILPVAAALIALILLALLRSIVAPLYLVPAVLLGFAATMGASVFVFQGIQGTEGEIFHLPIMLYLFVLAIGTDYNILITARLREEAKEGHEPRRAAALAVQHSGPTIAAAGLILAATFSVMLLAKVSMLQQMGFSIAMGIALSAFVMALFLVPSITALLGRAAWWPGHGGTARRAPVQAAPPQDPMADNPYAPTGSRY
ncbi:MMPL family transporter [Actinomadura oligospora]|uniref:MMPL family transporter n=1 Tax=Actinomadura oligospora TaxID=111804 RepID=UPI00047A2ACA|nr:MMPL family transporter [Actinomadura oligospora]